MWTLDGNNAPRNRPDPTFPQSKKSVQEAPAAVTDRRTVLTGDSVKPRSEMIQAKNRLRFSCLGISAARLFSSGPGRNPVVFLDIEADSEPVGRIIIEVNKHFSLREQGH